MHCSLGVRRQHAPLGPDAALNNRLPVALGESTRSAVDGKPSEISDICDIIEPASTYRFLGFGADRVYFDRQRTNVLSTSFNTSTHTAVSIVIGVLSEKY